MPHPEGPTIDDEFLVCDIYTEVIDPYNIAPPLDYMLIFYACHLIVLLIQLSCCFSIAMCRDLPLHRAGQHATHEEALQAKEHDHG